VLKDIMLSAISLMPILCASSELFKDCQNYQCMRFKKKERKKNALIKNSSGSG
jgi:hypothetical protein